MWHYAVWLRCLEVCMCVCVVAFTRPVWFGVLYLIHGNTELAGWKSLVSVAVSQTTQLKWGSHSGSHYKRKVVSFFLSGNVHRESYWFAPNISSLNARNSMLRARWVQVPWYIWLTLQRVQQCYTAAPFKLEPTPLLWGWGSCLKSPNWDECGELFEKGCFLLP